MVCEGTLFLHILQQGAVNVDECDVTRMKIGVYSELQVSLLRFMIGITVFQLLLTDSLHQLVELPNLLV